MSHIDVPDSGRARSSGLDAPEVFLAERINIFLPKSPLFSLFESGQNVLTGKFVDRVGAEVQNPGHLPAVQQVVFSFQRGPSSRRSLPFNGERDFVPI
jgi:hypothetical protein